MPKKTIKVAQVIDTANKVLASELEYEGKKAVSIFLEALLLDNGSYEGFEYLNPDDLSEGGSYARKYLK
ncbi:MAG: hypothetical protein KAJ19_12845 [Gammaproteobacteria bacterium]|nr:hypothetical protein [Gammaproteobacteria bacterium]